MSAEGKGGEARYDGGGGYPFPLYVDVLQGSDILLPMFTGWPLGREDEVAYIPEVSAALPKSMFSSPGKCGIGRSEIN